MRRLALAAALLPVLAIGPALAQKPGSDSEASPDEPAAELGCETRLDALQAMLDDGTVPDRMRPTLQSVLTAAGTFCQSGMDMMADQQLDTDEQLIAALTGQEGEQEPPAMSREEAGVTDAYLAGDWCYRHPGGESGYYVFTEDGTYQLGPVSMRYELVHEGETDALFERYDGIASVAPDQFTVNYHQVVLTFTRGTCEEQ